MAEKKQAARMTAFTKADIDNLLADLQLYSGNIREISAPYDLHPPGIGSFGGTIHTWMDTFTFSALPFMCDEETWAINLVDPAESIRCGFSMQSPFRFPKLHKSPALQERYIVANALYKAYHGYTNVTEASRLPHYEKTLGYDKLPTYQHVLDAIVRDFRSFQQSEDADAKLKNAKN